MTKQDVPVESETAQRLAAQASKKGKTLYSLTNEILEAALRVYGEGGNANEMFPAWKVSRMGKEISGTPFLPRRLIRKMVERLYPRDREWLLQEWVEAGKELGNHLRAYYPTLEDLQAGMPAVQPLIEERRFEIERQRGPDELHQEILMRVDTDLAPELAACGERFLVGLLHAYSFRATKSRVTGGNIEVTAAYVGPPA